LKDELTAPLYRRGAFVRPLRIMGVKIAGCRKAGLDDHDRSLRVQERDSPAQREAALATYSEWREKKRYTFACTSRSDTHGDFHAGLGRTDYLGVEQPVNALLGLGHGLFLPQCQGTKSRSGK